MIFTSDILSYIISFFRESYLTISPSNKGADLPSRGIVKAKINYHIIKLGKMYKVLVIMSYTLALKMKQNVKNYSKKDTTESITLDISSSFNAG